jgi:hypothetical protein
MWLLALLSLVGGVAGLSDVLVRYRQHICDRTYGQLYKQCHNSIYKVVLEETFYP